ncbi:nuclear transport factor 2 family protein [Hyphobacterium sp.]|uniref:nuclear transport factor 2 family protein n=1 Tax=Hyphobacterium sp. TaxID=2004662 RepID=UPI00374A4061
MHHVKGLALCAALLALTTPVQADDTASIDRIVTAVYDVISGEVGEERDWDRFRSLFAEGAIMTSVNPLPDGSTLASTFTPEDYIARHGPALMQIGFVERETRRAVYRYGEVATVLTAYEASRGDTGEVFLTGVNTIVLVHTGGEWQVNSITWRNGPAIPVDEAFMVQAE